MPAWQHCHICWCLVHSSARSVHHSCLLDRVCSSLRTVDFTIFFENTAHTLNYRLRWIAAKYVDFNFRNMLCSKVKIRSCEHTVIRVLVTFTITKRITASMDVDTQTSDPFAVFWMLGLQKTYSTWWKIVFFIRCSPSWFYNWNGGSICFFLQRYDKLLQEAFFHIKLLQFCEHKLALIFYWGWYCPACLVFFVVQALKNFNLCTEASVAQRCIKSNFSGNKRKSFKNTIF